MKNDTQFRGQGQGPSRFPMNNKIVKTEKKLQEQHEKEELKTARAEALNRNPKVQAAKAEVTAWVKEKTHEVEAAVPKVVARVSKMMAAKPKRKAAPKRRSPAKAPAVSKARTAKKTAKTPARRKLH